MATAQMLSLAWPFMIAVTLVVSPPPLVAAATEWQYRIVNDSATGLSGRLEVIPPGETGWGTVCDNYFSNTDALVACRSVYPDRVFNRARAHYNYGGGTGPIYMSEVGCSSSAQSLSACTYKSAAGCTHSEDVGITCYDERWEVELRNSTTTGAGVREGVVFVRPNDYSEWGTICSRAVYNAVARTLCGSLGFDLSRTLPSLVYDAPTVFSTAVPESAPVYLTYVDCSSTLPADGTLNNCTYYDTDRTGCFGNAAVGLKCLDTGNNSEWGYQLASSPSPAFTNRGVLLVRPTPAAEWGTVCSSNADSNTAIVACRSLGFANATMATAKWTDLTAFASTFNPTPNYPEYLGDIVCHGNESSLSECQYTGGARCSSSPGYSSRSIVVLDCNAWEARIQQTGAATRTTGIIQVRPNSSAPWGYICDDGFDATDAVAACATLGGEHSFVRETRTFAASTSTYGFRDASLPVYIDDMVCTTKSQGVGGCGFAPMSVSQCGANDEIKLECTVDIMANGSDWQVSVMNTLLVVNAFVPDGPNYYVCASGIDATAAHALCRAMGYPADVQATVTAAAYGVKYLTGRYLRGITCPTGATDLSQCIVTSSSTEYPCSANQVASLQCRSDSMTNVTFDTRVVTWATPGATAATLGRVQVKPNNSATWGSICQPDAAMLDQTNALAFCRAAGYASIAYAAPLLPNGGDSAGQHQHIIGPLPHGETWVSNVLCSAALVGANANPPLTNWQQCAFTAPGSCTSGRPAGADCEAQSMESRFVLTNGTVLYTNITQPRTEALLGRIEVRPNSTSAWGTVCAKHFENVDATRVCETLGWPADATEGVYRRWLDVRDQFTSTYGYYDHHVPIHISDLGCTTSDRGFQACPRMNSPSFPYCNHYLDVYLTCALAASPVQRGWQARIAGGGTSGRLEVRPDSASVWGTVCDDEFDAVDARVACNMIYGVSNVTYAYVDANVAAGNGPVYVSRLHCNDPRATSLAQCSYGTGSHCSHSRDVGVACALRSELQTWQARLTGAPNTTAGRLEVRPNSTAAWGTVCSNMFDARAADAACRQLGLWEPGTTAAAMTGASAPWGTTEGPIYMTDVACGGLDTLFACDFNGHIASIERTCTHLSDVRLQCLPPTTMPPTTTAGPTVPATTPPWSFVLTPGSLGYLPRRGLLQTRQGGGAWGSVCSTAFDPADAVVGCRSLGFAANASTAHAWPVHQQLGSSNATSSPFSFNSAVVGPMLLEGLRCSGDEGTLDACARDTGTGSSCTSDRAVLIDCNAWQAELRNGYDSPELRTGRLFVRPNASAPWGTVCHSNIAADLSDAPLAAVACAMVSGGRQVLSASFADPAAPFVPTPNGSVPVYMAGPVCPTTATTLAACGFSQPNATCRANRDASDFALVCRFGSVTPPPPTTPPTSPPGTTTNASTPPSPTPTAANSGWAARFAAITSRSNSSGITEGVVEVRPVGLDTAWGAVCTAGFDSADAAAFCRTLGFTGDRADFVPVARGSYDGPASMSNVQCPSDAQTLNNCSSLTPDATCATAAANATVLVALRCWTPGTPVNSNVVARVDPVTLQVIFEPASGSASSKRRQGDSGEDGPPADYTYASYRFCPRDSGAFPEAAATMICEQQHGAGTAFYGVASVVRHTADSAWAREQPWRPVYATHLVCPAAARQLSDCAFHNASLDTPVCLTEATVSCVLNTNASTWSTAMSNGQITAQFAPGVPAVQICGATVDWAVAVAGCRSVANATSADPAAPNDAIVSKSRRIATYTSASFRYDCGGAGATEAPASLDHCAAVAFENQTTGDATCGIDVAIECGGVEWGFAEGATTDGHRYVMSRPSTRRHAYRPVAVSRSDRELDAATLEVACRSLGFESAVFERRATLHHELSFGNTPYIVDPACSDASAPTLARCDYEYGPYSLPSEHWAVAIDCRVWPTWLLVVVIVCPIVVVALIIAGVAFCCWRRRQQQKRVAAMRRGVIAMHDAEGGGRSADADGVDDDVEEMDDRVVTGRVVGTPYGGGETPDARTGAAFMRGSTVATRNAAGGESPVLYERQRLSRIIRGHAMPSGDAFSFGLLGAITNNFATRAPHASPDLDATWLECADVFGGVVTPALASVSVVPEHLAADFARRVGDLARSSVAAPASDASCGSCLPALYGVAVAWPDDVNATAVANAMNRPPPPPGCVFVALLSELPPPSHPTLQQVNAERVVKPAETAVTAVWVARAARALAGVGVTCTAMPHTVAVRPAGGAPFPFLLAATADPVGSLARAHDAVVSGVRALESAAGAGPESLLPTDATPSLDVLVAHLEGAAAADHLSAGRPPRLPFDPDAPSPLTHPTWGACTRCGRVPPIVPGASRAALLRCTAATPHTTCAGCVAAGGNARQCLANAGACPGVWMPSDVAPFASEDPNAVGSDEVAARHDGREYESAQLHRRSSTRITVGPAAAVASDIDEDEHAV
eukprot:CAMPEP_0174878268 /NCGR_PEP_ID=MMETSP1114-20130205/82669_1 /TAXON_ID=312471 /ORGANISM="Neobodo designis, Strain CCAP 1951/1" /LENGTH=2450 /DNA_ID=CAMNT_0016113655 /DNA_START=284 /DNA_END=7636 /DNA_ORIENTATION=-